MNTSSAPARGDDRDDNIDKNTKDILKTALNFKNHLYNIIAPLFG